MASVVVAATAAGQAQPATSAVAAEELFREGRSLLDQGRFAEACDKLQASQKLDPAVGTLLSLGRCYEGQSRLASAWFAYRKAAALAAGRDDRRRVAAQGLAAQLEPKLAHIAIHLVPGAGTVELSVDGAPIVAEALGTPLPVDPGSHRIAARATRTFMTVAEVPSNGVTVDVQVPALDAPPASRRPSWKRPVGLGLVSAGAATVAMGAIFGLQAIVKARDANRACQTPPDCNDASAVQENDRARVSADVATVLLPVGAAVAALGGFFLLTSSASVETTVSPSVARLAVRWSW